MPPCNQSRDGESALLPPPPTLPMRRCQARGLKPDLQNLSNKKPPLQNECIKKKKAGKASSRSFCPIRRLPVSSLMRHIDLVEARCRSPSRALNITLQSTGQIPSACCTRTARRVLHWGRALWPTILCPNTWRLISKQCKKSQTLRHPIQ